MRITTKNAIALAIALAGLSACGISEGNVYEKAYEPERNWTTQEADYDKRCTGTGTKRTCVTVFDEFETVEHHEDECYRIRFRKDGDTGDACVSREVYDSLAIGDYYKG